MNVRGGNFYCNNAQMHQNEEIGGEYLYSVKNNQETGDEKVKGLTPFPNSTTKRNDRKKRPVSRQDSNFYDLASPTTELGLSQTSQNASVQSSTIQDSEKKKADKKETTGKDGHSVTINFNKRCIFIFIVCAIVIIAVGTGIIFLYKEGLFDTSTTPPVKGNCKNKGGSFGINVGVM